MNLWFVNLNEYYKVLLVACKIILLHTSGRLYFSNPCDDCKYYIGAYCHRITVINLPLFWGITSGFFSSMLSMLSSMSLLSGMELPLSPPGGVPLLPLFPLPSSRSFTSSSPRPRSRITTTMMTATSTRAVTTPIRTPRIGVMWRIAGVAAEILVKKTRSLAAT